MPVYEYVCEACENQYEMMQAISVNAEETVCPKCNATQSKRIMSAFASKVVGTHKTGFQEMKAYDMLGERMNNFSKLPSISGQRAAPSAENSLPPGAVPSDSA
ncbi:MAG: FmdB family zinc ribbon protein [Nitrospirales bacterium]